ncbi:NBR1-Ig-like domain-containing protein [Actinomadura welshii]|uniref:NBR1-Ig-like domain-containing protein n=1 Tax=Actinomadura welshii TaxID=3103817 RepID=UPI000415F425|nr:NBR1-Ig-like domain-containing protein [Actinomadura madurae]
MDDRRAQEEAVADFAEALRELRKSVGNPPFREMSGRSGAISHTTLHEATKGNRLPSWGTTAEFVKACGAEPAEYRERWESANRVVGSAGAGKVATAAGAVEGRAVHIDIGADGEVPRAGGAPERRGRFRPSRPVALALATAAVGMGTAIVIVVAVDRDSRAGGDGLKPSGSLAKATLSPADCPVRASNPPAAPPRHRGDAATFIADITLPDCTRVGTGKAVTKVWRLKNSGKVPWEGYSLRRIDVPQRADQCQTISDVPIDDTRPGKMVDIRTDITTPRKPGLCYVRFKMVDASGKVAFPGSRPVNFQIIVQ